MAMFPVIFIYFVFCGAKVSFLFIFLQEKSFFFQKKHYLELFLQLNSFR